VPVDGKPFRTTLPVATVQVGWVIAPITGAVGSARTVTFVDDEAEDPLHPYAVILIVAIPEKEGDQVTVPIVPVPEIVLPVPVTVQV
jgi:hypothetical protein